ncbi:MAG: hypothetical protein ABJB47_12625 [Actinomycetota bacterium]
MMIQCLTQLAQACPVAHLRRAEPEYLAGGFVRIAVHDGHHDDGW